jgi:hypothetical protein
MHFSDDEFQAFFTTCEVRKDHNVHSYHSKSMNYWLKYLVVFGFVCLLCGVDGFTPFPPTPKHLEGWAKDAELQSLMGDQCDFPIISMHEYGSFGEIPFKNTPFIIRNATYYWAANYNWQKGMFRKLYGDNVFRTGSESSIVYSGGHAEVAMYVKDLLSFPDNAHGQKESFAFDTTILQAIPELWSDFEIPKLFQEWDSEEREKNRMMWHFLSLGPSRSGTNNCYYYLILLFMTYTEDRIALSQSWEDMDRHCAWFKEMVYVSDGIRCSC